MRHTKNLIGLLLRSVALVCTPLLTVTVQAAAPGINGTGAPTSTTATFDLTAAAGYISQPDGASVYSWGYGCNTAPGAARFLPATVGTTQGAKCTAGQMQLPGPTLVVTQGAVVTVTLHNNLPAAAGNTSILFPGFAVTGSTGAGTAAGVLTREATHLGAVTYTFTATTPGTHSYYSGTRGDLQIEMGLYGALIVLPNSIPTSCGSSTAPTQNDLAKAADRVNGPQADFRLARAAYNNPSACYDREYLFQFSEMDPVIHRQAEEQAITNTSCAQPTGCMVVDTEPYHPAYFMINGRSMPDLMDGNYASQYPLQPYNGNPHMHPGELTLVRVIGQGRWQHPFHEHANHVRVLARDGNLLVNAAGNLAGPLLFTTTTTPGQTLDGIFQWTGKGLNWDVYGHADGITSEPCVPDANGYYTSVPAANNYYEWCGDHNGLVNGVSQNRALEAKPFGQVGSGGPVTLPDANILANGAWYSGSPYLGPDANLRSVGTTPIPPFGTVANSPSEEAGFAYMWHSHNERELTTNNIFPGGMMMMMLVDPWVFVINEAK